MLDIIDELIEEDAQKNKFLIFSIDKEQYGIEIKYVMEIIGIQKITTVPELPEYIKGVINLRGKIIPVMDVRIRFNKDVIEYDDRTCIIVVQMKDICIGLVIDRVLEVVDIEESQITLPPQMGKNSNRYINGIGKSGEEVKLLINCDELLNDDEMEELKK